MPWWTHLSALGGLNVTALLALAVAAWLAGARCWRLARAWCLLFGAAMLVAAASQMAFMGWGIGIEALSFTGFSGHAARAAAVFPVALFLLLERQARALRRSAVAAGVLLGAAVAVARVEVGAHSASEALAGCLLGLAAAAVFIARARKARDCSPQPLLLGVLAATLLLPFADPINAHQWLTAATLKLSGRDRIYLRDGWQPARAPYVPPCAPQRVRYDVLCP
ncbi:phosphatase PAP2 family protein [uncultured Massilia sp.]|uniref:phosphatase PAP2 family protein n=1 Tax=uncultured Massilia sp. TaxID=169973 RepID=UPI0025E5AE8D|nr:phosphatase PAP2 family protein [uncultured Massilia sp.]